MSRQNYLDLTCLLNLLTFFFWLVVGIAFAVHLYDR